MRSGFFDNPVDDANLEGANAVFWSAMLDHIANDLSGRRPRSVLDIGCHAGGLLARISERWRPTELFGIEPIPSLRQRAESRLHGQAESVVIVDSGGWDRIPIHRVDLVTCHEVLYLIDDVQGLMASVAARLTQGGGAYFVLGCHIENPTWPRWKRELQTMGHQVHDHSPLDVLTAGVRAGLAAATRPLRADGWVQLDPTRSEFAFTSVAEAVDHHFRQKLLFRFVRQ